MTCTDRSAPYTAELIDDIRGAADFESLCELTLRAARLIAASDGATFVVRDDDRCFYVAEDAVAALWKGQRFPIDECISGWAMLHGEPALVPDIRRDARVPVEAYAPTFVHSLAMIPMGDTDPRGAIGVYWARTGRGLHSDDLTMLSRVAAEAGRAITRLGLEAAPWAPTFGRRSPADYAPAASR